VYKLAKLIAAENIDVITGGGPGLMQAACQGHCDGRKNNDSQSIGLNILMPLEQKPNRHLDIKSEFDRFSERLDAFMILSDAVVVAPGGVGTVLEFAYTWQLVQVKHICNIPIILMGEMWASFLDWIKEYPLKNGLLKKIDVDRLILAKDANDAIKIIKKFHEGFKKGDDICLNFKKYKRTFEKRD
jgi:predicted Rossmann-fold nucleotide-binding protein